MSDRVRSIAVGKVSIWQPLTGSNLVHPVYAAREMVPSWVTQVLIKSQVSNELEWLTLHSNDRLELCFSLREANELTKKLAKEAAKARIKEPKRQQVIIRGEKNDSTDPVAPVEGDDRL